MEKQTLLSADYLDIIYDQRNKAYGGYELRKHYNRRVGKACAFLLLGVSALASFSFIPSGAGNIVEHPHGPVVLTDVSIEPPKEVEKVKLGTLPPPPPPPAVKTKVFIVPKITDDPVPDDKHMTENKNMHDAISGPSNNDVDSGNLSIGPPIINNKPGGGPAVITESKPAEPVIWVPQMPQFNGDMNDYISKHINYPEMARSTGVQGKVLVKFVVNEDGSVSNAAIARGIGGGCDEEALRIVRAMPKWKPGRQNGIPVKVYFTLPLSFEIN